MNFLFRRLSNVYGRFDSDIEESHPIAISRRIKELLLHLRQVDEKLAFSRLAEVLGYPDSQFIDRMMLGVDHISFEELDDFARRTALSSSWVKHGEGSPFELSNSCLGDIEALLGVLPKSSNEAMYAIRSDDEFGSVCFARRDNHFCLS